METITKRSTRKCNLTYHVGKRLKRIRKELGFTQEDVAVKMESHREVVARIENAKVSISLNTLERLAQALGIDVIELIQSN